MHKRDVGEVEAGRHPDNTSPLGYVNTRTDPHVEYLAHHWLLLAVPASLPAVVVVGVVLYVALRDRRAVVDVHIYRLIPAVRRIAVS